MAVLVFLATATGARCIPADPGHICRTGCGTAGGGCTYCSLLRLSFTSSGLRQGLIIICMLVAYVDACHGRLLQRRLLGLLGPTDAYREQHLDHLVTNAIQHLCK